MTKQIDDLLKHSHLFLIILFCLSILTNWVIEQSAITDIQPTKLFFSLPLPNTIIAEYNLPSNPDIEKVYVSGPFCDWDEHDPNYLMQKEPLLPSTYSTSVLFDPGKNQYKFVVYLKDYPRPVWIHDIHTNASTDDGNGGINSVISIFDIQAVVRNCNIILYLLFFLWGLIILLKTNSHIYSTITISILSLALLRMHHDTYVIKHDFRSYARYMYIQCKNADIDFETSNNIDNQGKLTRILNNFLWNDMTKIGQSYIAGDFKFINLFYATPQNIESTVARGGIRTFEKKEINLEDTYELRTLTKMIIRQHHLISPPQNQQKGSAIQSTLRYAPHFPYLFLTTLTSFAVTRENKTIGIIGIYYRSGSEYTIFWLVLAAVVLSLFTRFFRHHPVFENVPLAPFSEYKITEREQEIIERIAKGMSNKQISAELQISQKTVDNHIYNIFQKTGVKNRVELINLFYKSPQ